MKVNNIITLCLDSYVQRCCKASNLPSIQSMVTLRSWLLQFFLFVINDFLTLQRDRMALLFL